MWWGVFFLISCVYGLRFSIKHAAIVNFVPFIKLHDVVVIDSACSVVCVDFSPSIPRNLVKLVLGENVPAEIRIRKLPVWSLDDWYKSPILDINDIEDADLRQVLNEVLDEWPIQMNLYSHNCKHFSRYFILKLMNF